MLLKRIVLTDFGPYAGRTAFDLKTSEGRPVILFGGKNGAGKTTLFNSIQLCLHGRSAFEERLSQSEYEARIQGLLHEAGDKKATEASIRLEFGYANLGDREQYTVKRSFRDRGKSVVEDLQIKRDGTSLTDLDEEQWDDFLKELIPPGISDLFFFDGEKIQQLADAIDDGGDFDESLMSLLGLDLVDRLDADLSIYLSQKLDEEGHEEMAEAIESVRERKNDLEAERSEIESKISDKEERLSELQTQIDQKEQRLTQEGGSYAAQRDEYQDEKAGLESKIESLQEEIREIATTHYPFVLVPELCRQVVEQLETETEATRKAAAQTEAVEVLDELANDRDIWTDAGVDPQQSEQVVDSLQSALRSRLEPETNEQQLAETFSQKERQDIKTVVSHTLDQVPDKLGRLTSELERAVRRRQELEQKINRAPDESVIKPIVSDISDLNDERARLNAELEDHRERLSEVENMHARVEQELENKLSAREEIESVSERADLASQVRDTVQSYRERLIEEKLETLEKALTNRYLKLTNKSDYYERVLVDPQEVSIAVETTDGDLKHQSQLSAGERQIFATALLWALADISDRPLPFIVDTPLGRLDQEHRENIVSGFFPNAAHQVLLFSTDTEITDEYRDVLEDDLAAEYHLEYDEGDGRTSVSPGYFWTDPDDAVQDRGVEQDVTVSSVHKQIHLKGFNDD
jgi:DNA sulfur modification protein DndD